MSNTNIAETQLKIPFLLMTHSSEIPSQGCPGFRMGNSDEIPTEGADVSRESHEGLALAAFFFNLKIHGSISQSRK